MRAGQRPQSADSKTLPAAGHKWNREFVGPKWFSNRAGAAKKSGKGRKQAGWQVVSTHGSSKSGAADPRSEGFVNNGLPGSAGEPFQ